jgi:hypothetical protein
LSLKGKAFDGAVQFIERYFAEEETNVAILALQVFVELGIFSIKNSVFCHDEKVKNALTNSKVYSKISILIG